MTISAENCLCPFCNRSHRSTIIVDDHREHYGEMTFCPCNRCMMDPTTAGVTVAQVSHRRWPRWDDRRQKIVYRE